MHVRFLLENGEFDVNVQTGGGSTALILSCKGGHVNFVEWLLGLGGVDAAHMDQKGLTATVRCCITIPRVQTVQNVIEETVGRRHMRR